MDKWPPESPMDWLAQITARLVAQEQATALLFVELVGRDRAAAKAAAQQLRIAAAMPLGAGAATAIEVLAAEWERLLAPAAPP